MDFRDGEARGYRWFEVTVCEECDRACNHDIKWMKVCIEAEKIRLEYKRLGFE